MTTRNRFTDNAPKNDGCFHYRRDWENHDIVRSYELLCDLLFQSAAIQGLRISMGALAGPGGAIPAAKLNAKAQVATTERR